MMSTLISKGARGTPLAKALVSAVQQKLEAITILLLDHKASADYNDAQALQIASIAGDLDTVKLILSKGKPQPQSMRYVLPLVPPGPPRLRHDMTKSIIDAASTTGIPTPLLDIARMEVVDTQFPQIDLDYINLVVVAGADVNCLGGKSLQIAARRGSIELLELLVRMIGGANGDQISRELVCEICSSQECDPQLIKLLIDHGAKVDYSEGQALKYAVSMPTKKEVLELLLESKGATTILSSLVPLAMNHTQETRPQKLQMLLEKGARGTQVHNALIDAVKQGPSTQPTIDMSLHYNASVNY